MQNVTEPVNFGNHVRPKRMLTTEQVEAAELAVRTITMSIPEITDNRAHRAAAADDLGRRCPSIHIAEALINSGRAVWVDDVLVCS